MQYSKLISVLLVSLLTLSACGGSDSNDPLDTDGDGVEDTLDSFPNDAKETKDTDKDGVGDNSDAFPNDASETLDSDEDGVGDNTDVFPNDASETIDSDEDGVGDNADAFPNDASESLDTDEDGVGDNADAFPNDASETLDTDEDGVGDNADAFPNDPTKTVTACIAEGTEVNFEALESENCELLSQYNLFSDPSNPTTGVNGSKSLPYDLSMPLFTDYATKYRFVVIPEDKSGAFKSSEVMDLPVGSVLIKTFSLPADTSIRGYENEKLIETRLLIHRTSGWASLPYVWNAEGTEAEYKPRGKSETVSLTHNGTDLEFTYTVPSDTQCRECHQLLDTDENGKAVPGSGKIWPIGPKARFLNHDYSYADQEKNQLLAWSEKNMLTDLPFELSDITTVPVYQDDDAQNLKNSVWSAEYINTLARGYLDINCAHCHRPIGSANNYGLFLENNRELSNATGICKDPIAAPGNSSLEGKLKDIKPGDADNSFLYERITSEDAGLKMPKIGRSLVHTEGTLLIKTWIDLLDKDPFNQTSCP
ncbi:thrombospondin type 3 repeat-containing protein [Psychrosphaera sp. F3M07]|uniref:SO2930 family diheme c-type cytochrome n=1 Tax=Psychrosphaera sp. F3M07 TaxID=2841560 RepID=UPI001C0A5E2A|nr:SO2930 family diheme c-type cytochrome [Psychrosphaera sp. F3M07]MBU2918616.1 thrombospondin type 3 repeat-containing protein [Psychrosphaera sp. F3M07]